MRRNAFVWLLITVGATAFGQEPKESIPPPVPQPHEDPNRIVYDLEISPADEPKPAMKYRLLPDPADLKPGNAATQYYKALVLESEPPFRTPAYHKLIGWLDTPLRDLNTKELGETLKSLDDRVFYGSIRKATFRINCVWEEPIEEEGVALLVPAVFDLRSASRLLAMKAKYEIARGQFDDAMETSRDILTLGYHLQRNGDFMLQSVAGIEVSSLVYDNVLKHWLESPKSPNLYWALSEVPPYFDSRRVMAGDLRSAEYTLHSLKEIEKRPFTAEEAADLATRAFTFGFSDSRLDRNEATRRVQLTAWAVQDYDNAARVLIEFGFSKELLDQMPVLQVVMLARWKAYQQSRDDLYKWSALLYGSDRELALRKQREILSESRDSAMPFSAFLPSLSGMYRVQLRQFRYLSALRAIEAIRLYAARHGGFPDSLSDIHEVPVPNDPVTNAPFVYRRVTRTATLTMVRHDLGSGIEYEYRLRLRQPVEAK